jgi:hypothetical protein
MEEFSPPGDFCPFHIPLERGISVNREADLTEIKAYRHTADSS